MREIVLGKNKINDFSKPYIIAEIGVNHEGSFEKAKELVLQAKQGGANAAKFQSYKAETLASKESPSYWDLNEEPTTSQFELFKKFDKFEEKEFISLAEYCAEIGIDFLSTPFDDDSIEFLFPLMPFYKIASADLTNIPFIRRIAKKNKPILLSTGASNISEICMAVKEICSAGCNDISLMHCILNYPTINKNANLRMISSLRQSFPEIVIGYSDHTLPNENMTSLTTAFALGARIIEKHFTFDKTLLGNDQYHSMCKDDLKVLIKQISKIHELIGPIADKQPIETEEISRLNARRSIALKQNVLAHTTLEENMITYLRPGNGISPVYWDRVIGSKVKISLEKGQILHWENINISKD